MAMPVEVTVWAITPERAEAGARAAFAAFARVDALMNDYVADSEISRASAAAGGGPTRVSEETLMVLRQATRISALAGGAFDITAGPVVALWRTAAKTGEMPDAAKLAAARKLVGSDKLRLNESNQSVELMTPGMKLDFGGIAKGYACDLATAALNANGLTITYVQAGGDMKLGDAPPGTDGWLIDVPGRKTMTLQNTAVSISGDTARFALVGGVRYSHVVDPRTGVGVTSRQTAVVLAPRGLDSDPLATAGCVLPPEQFRALVAELDGVSGLVFAAPPDDEPSH